MGSRLSFPELEEVAPFRVYNLVNDARACYVYLSAHGARDADGAVTALAAATRVRASANAAEASAAIARALARFGFNATAEVAFTLVLSAGSAEAVAALRAAAARAATLDGGKWDATRFRVAAVWAVDAARFTREFPWCAAAARG